MFLRKLIDAMNRIADELEYMNATLDQLFEEFTDDDPEGEPMIPLEEDDEEEEDGADPWVCEEDEEGNVVPFRKVGER